MNHALQRRGLTPFGYYDIGDPEWSHVQIERGLTPSDRFVTGALLRRNVRGRQTSVDHERRAVDVRGLVARQEERRVHDLARFREPAHRQMNSPAFICRRIVAEDPQEKRRLDRTWAQRVDPDALPRELHGELTAEREYGSLRSGVRDLRRRSAD